MYSFGIRDLEVPPTSRSPAPNGPFVIVLIINITMMSITSTIFIIFTIMFVCYWLPSTVGVDPDADGSENNDSFVDMIFSRYNY